MDVIGQKAAQLALLLEPLAAMMVKRIHPVDDEISMNAAYREYGRAWIEAHRERGNLLPRGKGNKLVLSRADIETLRAVESERPKVSLKTGTKSRQTRK